jgi:uncharacterized repeat protein (TIGR03803 family)
MGKLGLLKVPCIVLLFCAGAMIASSAQTFTTLASFDGKDGNLPDASLVQGINGNFYGTALEGGGNHSNGTVFKITPGGKLTTLYSFCSQPNCTDGGMPHAALLQATNGNFYGTTSLGGANNNSLCIFKHESSCGTIFKITPGGKLTTLYSFCSQANCVDGYNPSAAVVQAKNGNFYGTTSYGGTGKCTPKCGGTAFKITPGGKLTTLYSFCSQSNCADGSASFAPLVQATDGNFYGTTLFGGANCAAADFCGGTVFKITPRGKLTTLYSFCSQANCTDGNDPVALVQATNGNLYGTTFYGGANNYGTVFEITPAGKLTTLYSFCSQVDCTDGEIPVSLVQATNGNFYGTAGSGGANFTYGTVFEITPAGKLTTLYSFCSQANCADGEYPAALVQATNGNFYGTTAEGGAGCRSPGGCGTVFRLAAGLSPFVEMLPGYGKVGAEVRILGNKLTGSSSVTFNGTPATFNVKSPRLILTHVPPGATTGYVSVNTPTGVLTSDRPFDVIP